MKKITAFLAAFITLMSFAACSDTAKDGNLFAENDILTTSAQDINNDTANSINEIDESNTQKEDDIIYKNDNVTVTKCVPLETPNIAYGLWDLPTEDEMYDRYEVITDVTINSLEEVDISYTFRGTECTSYKTLAAVSVNKIYYSDVENISQEFVVAIPNSSYCCDEDFPEIAIGKRCVFFISRTDGVEDSLEIYNYADYYLDSPVNIINIDGLECTANKVFSAYSSSSVAVKKETNVELFDWELLVDGEYMTYGNVYERENLSTGQCSMPFNDFENTLIAKINEKK